jgi:hypothetical protein
LAILKFLRRVEINPYFGEKEKTVKDVWREKELLFPDDEYNLATKRSRHVREKE